MKSNPAALVITVVIAALALGAGLIIGYLLRKPDGQEARQGIHGELTPVKLLRSTSENETGTFKECSDLMDNPDIKNYLTKARMNACRAATCNVELPRNYVVYHLDSDKVIIDGNLNEKAWQEVGWTESFVDVRGENFPAPRFETRVKMRWDDSNLYVGAYIQEFAVWANRTLHDTTIYQDNSFQVLFDTEQSNHKYKEISINALGTVADIMLTRPYMDDGEPLSFWESDIIRAIQIDGPVNDPRRRNQHWTVEMSLPFKQLFAGVTRENEKPKDKEIWRTNFVRSEWQTEIVGGEYHKRLDLDADWWVWQSPGVANIHLPDRWGLIQFRNASVNSTSFQPDNKWVVTNALLEVYRAEKAYKAVNGRYTDNKALLQLPPYIFSQRCIRDLDIELDWGGFRITAKSAEKSLQDGHTRTDRYVWFGDQKEQFYRK